MTVAEAIEKLKEMNPQAELHMCARHGGFFSTTEVDEVYADSTQVGILTNTPRTVAIVVLDTAMCGL